MNTRKTILILVALAIAAAGLLYTIFPRKAGNERTAGGERNAPGGDGVADRSKPAEPGSGITRPAPSEDVVAGGRDEGLTSAPPREAGALVDPQRGAPPLSSGEKADARVTVAGRSTEALVANELGEFPRVYIQPSQAVSVRVAFPQAEAGTRVVAQVEDGGKFADGKPVMVLTLDERREATFDFTAGAEPGAYRIAVRHGPDWKYVQLWAAAATGQ